MAHEALIRHWPTLIDWVNRDREFQSWLRHLQSKIKEWQAHPNDEGTLLRGGPLTVAEEWLARRRDELSKEERDYIEASISSRENAKRAKTAQRRWAMVILVVLMAAGATAGWQYLVAEQRAQSAQEQQALRYVADADRQLFQNPQQALMLAAQGLAASPTEATVEVARGAVRRTLDVIESRRAIQRKINWGKGAAYIAPAWFEGDLGGQHNRSGTLLLLTTERGKSGPSPPGEALLLKTATLETTMLDIGPAWGMTRSWEDATFRVKSGGVPAEIGFVCTEHPDEVGVLAIAGDGATEVTSPGRSQ